MDPRRDGSSTMSDELELTGWRRTVSELYAAVRAEDDPRRAHDVWRRGRDELFRSHPQSPLPPGDPLRATGLPYWPYDPGLRFELPLLPAERDLSLSVPTSEGRAGLAMARVHPGADERFLGWVRAGRSAGRSLIFNSILIAHTDIFRKQHAGKPDRAGHDRDLAGGAADSVPPT